jgi:hypothetical protein
MVLEKKIIKKSVNTAITAYEFWETGWSYIRHIIDTAREPFLILDDKLIVKAANEYFYNFFKVTSKETEQKLVYKIGNGQWNVSWLKNILNDVISKDQFFKDYEVDHEFLLIGRKVMLLNARQIHYPDKDGRKLTPMIILAMEDVTKQRLVEEKLGEYSKELELKVLIKTQELTERIEKMEIMNNVLADREVKMGTLAKALKEMKASSQTQETIVRRLNNEVIKLKGKVMFGED